MSATDFTKKIKADKFSSNLCSSAVGEGQRDGGGKSVSGARLRWFATHRLEAAVVDVIVIAIFIVIVVVIVIRDKAPMARHTQIGSCCC